MKKEEWYTIFYLSLGGIPQDIDAVKTLTEARAVKEKFSKVYKNVGIEWWRRSEKGTLTHKEIL